MDPRALTVYTSPFPKIRLGKDNDGGYVLADVPDAQYDLLLAGGVCDDVSFEEAFCGMYGGAMCYAFDGTIETPPVIHHPHVMFVKKNIGYHEEYDRTNLHEYIDAHSNIFVKMDIEGYEIPWFQSLTPDHMDKLTQMVVEFHFPFSDVERGVFEKLNRSHVLIHMHANNNCGVRTVKNLVMPNVFECTHLHKRYVKTLVPNRDPLPGPLDMPNVKEKDDISLHYPPFVSW